MNIEVFKSFLGVAELPLYKNTQSPEWLSVFINHSRTMVIVHQDTLDRIKSGEDFQTNTAIKAAKESGEEYTCITMVIRKTQADETL